MRYPGAVVMYYAALTSRRPPWCSAADFTTDICRSRFYTSSTITWLLYSFYTLLIEYFYNDNGVYRIVKGLPASIYFLLLRYETEPRMTQQRACCHLKPTPTRDPQRRLDAAVCAAAPGQQPLPTVVIVCRDLPGAAGAACRGSHVRLHSVLEVPASGSGVG